MELEDADAEEEEEGEVRAGPSVEELDHTFTYLLGIFPHLDPDFLKVPIFLLIILYTRNCIGISRSIL